MNTAKIRRLSWSEEESTPLVKPPSFSWSRGSNQQGRLPPKHFRDRHTSVGPVTLRRCELYVTTGLRSESQFYLNGEMAALSPDLNPIDYSV